MPLVYRERTYVVSPGTSLEVVEAILLARFGELALELSDRPKGKLLNMAAFDHAWSERPLRPPLLTLQWKDWRGDPIVTQPGQARPSAPPASPADPSSPPPAETTDTSARDQAAPSEAAPSEAAPSEAAVSGPTPEGPQAPASGAAAPEPVSEPLPFVAAAPTPVPSPPSDLGGVTDLELTFGDGVAFDRTPVEPSADERLATAFESLQDLFFLTTPLEGLEFVLRLLEDLVPTEAASACLYDINTDDLRFVVLTGPGADERRGEAVPRLAGLIGSAAQANGDALVVRDVANDPRFDPGIDGRVGLEASNMALAAVMHGGRLFGLLQIINRTGTRELSATDANILAYVAEKLGEFLQVARLRPE